MLALLLSACFLSPAPMTGEEYLDHYVDASCADCWEGRYSSEAECVESQTASWEAYFVDVGSACPDEGDLDNCLDALDGASCEEIANGVDGLDCFPSVLLAEDNCEDEA